MSDDDVDEEELPEQEADDEFEGDAEDLDDAQDAEDLEVDDLEEDLEEFSGEAAVDEDEEDEAEEETRPKARRVDGDEEEDEDEEVDPDDIEADLGEILRDRIAAGTDEDEDDEEDEAAGAGGPGGDVAPKRNDEFVCEMCFLVVNRSQFGSPRNPRCPMDEDDCPSIARLGL